MEKKPDPRVASLTGEAIKLMAESGASAETIGHFAVHYPSLVAAKLEPMPQPQDLDLEALIRATIQTMFGGALSGRSPELQAQLPERERGERGASRIKRNLVVGGKRTSVRVRTELYEQMVALSGKEADKQIQQFANEAPETLVNRSVWIEDKIRSFLVLSQVQSSVQH